ncbi:MAG: lectin subunit beta, partial [Pseudoxanthomonas sp.]
KYPHQFPNIDQLVFEPNAEDSELFFTNLFSFSARHRVCQLAYRNTLADLRKRADVLRPMLAAHGIGLRDEIINDRNRSLLTGLDVAPRMTETTARLRRALDDVDQVVAKRRVRRIPRRLKSAG